MPSPTTVRIAVSATASDPSTPSSKRRITPSSEQSSSKRSIILTTPTHQPTNISQGAAISVQPFFAPRQLFPSGSANISDLDPLLPLPRHILLPFNLRDPKVKIFEGDVCSLLYNIFPGTENVTEGRFRSHLLFQVKELPKSPLPLTVGGLPITVLENNVRGRATMFPWQNLGNFQVSLFSEIQGTDIVSENALRELAARVYDQFQTILPTVQLIEFMLTCERTFNIVIGNNTKIQTLKAKLPGKIANFPVGYLNESELHRPSWMDRQAKPHIVPQVSNKIIDSTAYDILRPGVLICSQILKEHSHLATISSSSGVLVQNSVGDRFMTAASHGIEASCQVWQEGRPEKVIGTAVVEVSWTHISLVELNKDIEFINEPFESASGVVPKFSRLITSEDDITWADCTLDSPYTGDIGGCIVQKSVKFESLPPHHPTQERLRFVLYNWIYTGQEEDVHDKFCPPDGVCGSAIWDNTTGIILGFYHYHINEGRCAGFSASVSASEVARAGYRLAD